MMKMMMKYDDDDDDNDDDEDDDKEDDTDQIFSPVRGGISDRPGSRRTLEPLERQRTAMIIIMITIMIIKLMMVMMMGTWVERWGF